MMVLDAEHHIRIHGDETAIGIEGEAAVAGLRRQGVDGLIVEAEIEHRIHHARHRGARPGAHRNEQWIFGITEDLSGQLADMRQRGRDLRLQVIGIALLVGVIVGADFGRDGEPGWHRQAEIGHFGKVRALAAQQIFHIRFAFGLAVAEGVDPLRHHACPGWLRFRPVFGRFWMFFQPEQKHEWKPDFPGFSPPI